MRNTALATNEYSDDYRNRSWDVSSGHLVGTPADAAYGYGWQGTPITGGTFVYRTPNPEVPQLLQQALDKANELLRLQPNWDSYGAKRVDIQSALTSLQILAAAALDEAEAPQVVPTPQGGVQFEWHGAHRHLELCVELPLITLFYEDANDPAKNQHRVVNVPEAVQAIHTLTKDLD